MAGALSNLPPLGDLEVAVLEVVWQSECSAKEAHELIGKRRGISLNTVQSTLERLYRKKLLSRHKAGHAYRYSALVRREELVASYIRETMGRFGSDAATSLAAFVDSVDDIDNATLERLEEIVRIKRQRGASS